MDKSGVVRVKIEGENEPNPTIVREEGSIPFVFVGTVESIANAKTILEYHLSHLKASIFIYSNFNVWIDRLKILNVFSLNLGSGIASTRKITN